MGHEFRVGHDGGLARLAIHPWRGGGPKPAQSFPEDEKNTDDPVYNPELDKKRGRAPQTMCWKLDPNEALIVEWDRNDLFWMMTNMGMMFNSMDYLYRPVSYSPSRAKTDRDGMVRLILAHQDPGLHNWMDTQGFERGVLCNRNMMTGQQTNFCTRVGKHAQLATALPDSPRISLEERQRQMLDRFHSILRRIGA